MINDDMEKNFSFDSIGKRMPYRMPENFLQDMEASVMRGIQAGKAGEDEPAPATIQASLPLKANRDHSRFRILFRSAVSAAAVATLFIVCYNTMRPRPTNGYEDIERAFDNLSSDDQAFMISTYSNDAFASLDDSSEF